MPNRLIADARTTKTHRIRPSDGIPKAERALQEVREVSDAFTRNKDGHLDLVPENSSKAVLNGARLHRWSLGKHRVHGEAEIEEGGKVSDLSANIVTKHSTGASSVTKQVLIRTLDDGNQVCITRNPITKSCSSVEIDSRGNLVQFETLNYGSHGSSNPIHQKLVF